MDLFLDQLDTSETNAFGRRVYRGIILVSSSTTDPIELGQRTGPRSTTVTS